MAIVQIRREYATGQKINKRTVSLCCLADTSALINHLSGSRNQPDSVTRTVFGPGKVSPVI